MSLTKVISGGQTGVDHAALRMALEAGLKTGGFAPFGYRTLAGPNLELRDVYGLQELGTSNYPARTERNVIESDGTLRIARDFSTPGEQCTLRFLRIHGKPFLDVKEAGASADLKQVVRVANWIQELNITTLNVAGNSETTAPGIKTVASVFLRKVFQLVNARK
jgi:hypothetical protein